GSDAAQGARERSRRGSTDAPGESRPGQARSAARALRANASACSEDTMTDFVQKLPLFPTAVIGSLPRPAWLLDLLSEYLVGRLSRDEWEQACDRAVPFAVALQETAGIDVLTDGEWRREGYFQVFYERVEGFAPDLIPGRTRRWPAAVAPLR